MFASNLTTPASAFTTFSRKGRIPNLFIVGAPKCGTTAWVEYLSRHPEIAFSSVKEPHHFSTDIRGTGIANSVGKYARLFDHVRDEKIIADASVMHLFSARAARAINRFNPDAKILILLRDHVEFLKSYHTQSLYTGYEDQEKFDIAWRLSPDRQKGHYVPTYCTDPAMLDYPRIAHFFPQVERYYAAFPKQQIMLRWLDQWTADPRIFYLELMDFLGICDGGLTNFPPVHAAHAHRYDCVGKLTAYPPPSILKATKLIKALTGLHRLKIARQIRRWNTVCTSTSLIPSNVEQEIRARYKHDREQIAELVAS